MKNLFKYAFALVATLFATNASAQETVTFDFVANPWGKVITLSLSDKKNELNAFGSVTENGVTITTGKGTNATYFPAIRKIYDINIDDYSDPTLELVKGHTVDISVATGSIKGIDVNYSSVVAASKFAAGDWTSSITNSDLTEEIQLNNVSASVQLSALGSTNIRSIVVYLSSESGGNQGGGDNNDDDPTIGEDETVYDDNVIVDLSKRKLVLKCQYGDQLGEASRYECTGQKAYYYDKNLNLISVVNNKNELGGLYFAPIDYEYNSYNAQNQITGTKAFQIGTYDFGEKEARESTAGAATYEYNSNGQLVKKHTFKDGDIIYTYNAQGQLATEVRNNGQVNQKTLVYKYNADGTVASVSQEVSEEWAKSAPGEWYTEKYTYSAAGRKIKAERVYANDIEYIYANIGGKIMTRWHYADEPISKETWKYEGGYVKEYATFAVNNNGDFIPASRIIYNYEEGNRNLVSYTKENYNSSTDKWSLDPQSFTEEFKDFATIDASTYTTDILSVKQSTAEEDGLNTALVEFTIPQLIYSDPSMDLAVYRDGLRIQVINPAMWDIVPEFGLTMNEANGTLVYHDKHIKNGKHEYFIQTLPTKSGNGGFIPMADDDSDPDSGMEVIPVDHEESYIVSNLMGGEVFTQLPTPQNLRVVNKVAAQPDVKVTVEFDYDAEILPEYGFKQAILTNKKSLFLDEENPHYTSNPNERQLTDAYEATANVSLQVVARYELGTVWSEPLTGAVVDLVIVPTCIKTVNAELSNGNAMYFDLQGRQVRNATKGVLIRVANGKAQKVMAY